MVCPGDCAAHSWHRPVSRGLLHPPYTWEQEGRGERWEGDRGEGEKEGGRGGREEERDGREIEGRREGRRKVIKGEGKRRRGNEVRYRLPHTPL